MSQEPLSATIQIRLTHSQAQRLSEAAALAGIPLSQYLRRKLEEKDQLAENLDLLRELIASLNTLREIRSCAAESVLLARKLTMPDYVEEVQFKLNALGIPPLQIK